MSFGTPALELMHGNHNKNPFEHLESDHPQAWLADHDKDVPHQARCPDWARRTEDDMVRCVYINRAGSDRILLKHALDRYLSEVSSTKCENTANVERHKAKALKASLEVYSLAAITPDLIARYRDQRLEASKAANTVRLELSLPSHLFTIAIKEWRVGLFYNPVANVRKLAPAKGRDQRLRTDEEQSLLRAL